MHTIHLICTWQRENEKKQRLSLVFTMAEYCVVKWWDGNILRTPRIIMSLTRAERINVDQWWPALPGGAAVVFRRSGGEGDPCGEIPALLVLILTLLGGDGSELGSSPPAPPAQNQHCSLSLLLRRRLTVWWRCSPGCARAPSPPSCRSDTPCGNSSWSCPRGKRRGRGWWRSCCTAGSRRGGWR